MLGDKLCSCFQAKALERFCFKPDPIKRIKPKQLSIWKGDRVHHNQQSLVCVQTDECWWAHRSPTPCICLLSDWTVWARANIPKWVTDEREKLHLYLYSKCLSSLFHSTGIQAKLWTDINWYSWLCAKSVYVPGKYTVKPECLRHTVVSLFDAKFFEMEHCKQDLFRETSYRKVKKVQKEKNNWKQTNWCLARRLAGLFWQHAL